MTDKEEIVSSMFAVGIAQTDGGTKKIAVQINCDGCTVGLGLPPSEAKKMAVQLMMMADEVEQYQKKSD